MKKILVIPSWYPTKTNPLRGSFFKEQAEFLNQSGQFEIKILFGEVKSQKLLNCIKTYFKSFFGFRIRLDQEFSFKSPQSFYFVIPNNRWVSDRLLVFFSKRIYIQAFMEFVKNNSLPELIHAQSGMDAGIYAHSISKIHSIPFLITEHQVFVFHHYSRRKAKLILDAFKFADKVAVVSVDQRRQILMNQPDCNPEVIPNLIDDSKFEIVKKEKSDRFRIITFIYSNSIKGFETFFETMYLLNEKSSDFEFIVIGNGNTSGVDLFKNLNQKYGLEKKGKLIPKVLREDVPSMLCLADLYVCSSIYETFGIAPREAMMCGLPIVSTANGGLEDCISSETGVIVPIKDPRALMEAILEIKNRELTFDARIIRELALKKFGRRAFLNSICNFYSFE
ncbi:Glycosyltransferase involved in cell wall bisynthesis [Algoriphagus ornithinivorans]|uniref:Glycosyltransferase involved in cell wall bisynthesis n=1 Tax=Algoriphagus ornithinivorans TaxID=226506 RepID=A0A1I5HI03_9BACT|nr:glycosyltransferase [Algoriphagus ornithinivorans]SFO47857.1 Glycosyltransferase involved in cell wall bisynthesis [Algoriphagus ornithinivorans]